MKNYESFYQLEFDYIPRMAACYQRGGHKLLILNNKKAWQGTLTQLLPSIANGFDWDALRILTYGNEGDDTVVILYLFPEPFQVPLALYGACIIHNGEVNYYTLEKSFSEDYVIGSMAEGGLHMNFGNTTKLSPAEFLYKVCSLCKVNLPEPQKVEEKESLWSKIKKIF